MAALTAHDHADAALLDIAKQRAETTPDPRVYKTCIDCGGFPDDYMVQATVWGQACKSYKGHLCLACLENRLGRPLVIEDFTPCILNAPVFRGFLMGRRAK